MWNVAMVGLVEDPDLACPERLVRTVGALEQQLLRRPKPLGQILRRELGTLIVDRHLTQPADDDPVDVPELLAVTPLAHLELVELLKLRDATDDVPLREISLI